MNKVDFDNKSFDELVEQLFDECADITDYDTLKDFAISSINEGNLCLAIHILKSIQEDDADIYNYDYSMGTLNTPNSITCKDDLMDYIED